MRIKPKYESSMNVEKAINEIAAICDKRGTNGAKKDVTLMPASHYFSLHNMMLYTMGRNYYKLISKI